MSLRYFLLWLALLSGLRAQSPAPTPEDVSVEFRLYAWQVDIPSLRYGRDGKVEEVEASSRSEVHTYQGPPTLNFTLAKAKPTNSKPAPPVASVTLPQNVQRLTLLTVPAGRNQFKMYVLPEDSGNLPPKHARLYNLTTATLRVDYNETDRVDLPPATSALLAAKGRGVVIRVSRMNNGQWRPMFSNVIMPQASGGPNVLMTTGMENSGVGVFSVPSWPPEPPPADPAPASP